MRAVLLSALRPQDHLLIYLLKALLKTPMGRSALSLLVMVMGIFWTDIGLRGKRNAALLAASQSTAIAKVTDINWSAQSQGRYEVRYEFRVRDQWYNRPSGVAIEPGLFGSLGNESSWANITSEQSRRSRNGLGLRVSYLPGRPEVNLPPEEIPKARSTAASTFILGLVTLGISLLISTWTIVRSVARWQRESLQETFRLAPFDGPHTRGQRPKCRLRPRGG